MNCVATKVSLKSKDEIMKTLDDSGGNIQRLYVSVNYVCTEKQ